LRGSGIERRGARWLALLPALSLAFAVLGGCATHPSLVPDDSRGPVGAAMADPGQGAAGITVTAVAEAWDYSPLNLPDHATPVRVKVTNHRAESILLSFSDVFLIDDQGVRRPALQPADAVQLAARAQGDLVGPGASPGSTITLSQGIGIGGVGIQLGGIGLGGPGWPGGGTGYSEGGDRIDTLRVALRPGRLDPGTSVEGYLFFESPLASSDRDRRFLIAWDFRPVTPVNDPPAPPLARVEIPLVAR
jgi:hypothetical protein